jgi:hypothetical protein
MSDKRPVEENELNEVSGGFMIKNPTPVPPPHAPTNPTPPIRVTPTPGGPKPD